MTALGYAASRGHIDTVQFLLRSDIKTEDVDLDTPLFMAAAYGFPHIVELLLNKGALTAPGFQNYLAFMAWRIPISIEIFRMFLERGLQKSQIGEGKQALEVAMEVGRQDIAALLKEYGVTLDEETT